MRVTPARMKRWRNGANGFLEWVADVKPMIPSARGGFEVFHPTPMQEQAIRAALKRNADGKWTYTTIVLCWPRRHSKTIVNALLVLWRFTCWQTQTIKVLANAERQVLSTAFKLLGSITLNTPTLLEWIGKDNVTRYTIRYPDLQNEIQAIASNESAAYGEKVSIGWTTELHAAPDDSVLQVLASSVGDSEDGWILIDSTTDGMGGPIHKLEQLAETGDDPTVFVSRIEYANLDEALEQSPPWIRRDWLHSRSKQMLPAQFASQHLNQRGSAVNSLFKPEHIEAFKENYRCPVDPKTITDLFHAQKHVIGGGLDRAYGFSLHGDQTIWTAVAKVAGEDDEAHYSVLNQQAISFSSGRGIKKAIAEDHERYRLENACIEAYNSQDIAAWCQDAKIPTEIIHATSTVQIPAFTELHRIVAEGRLHFPAHLKGLADEMLTFQYDSTASKPKFGHAPGHRDDRVYSLCWAIWSLRDQELATYELSNIVCQSKSPHARLCYLRSGDLILHCSQDCEAHRRVEQMHLQHTRHKVDHELTLPEFFQSKVRVSGIRVRQAI